MPLLEIGLLAISVYSTSLHSHAPVPCVQESPPQTGIRRQKRQSEEEEEGVQPMHKEGYFCQRAYDGGGPVVFLKPKLNQAEV